MPQNSSGSFSSPADPHDAVGSSWRWAAEIINATASTGVLGMPRSVGADDVLRAALLLASGAARPRGRRRRTRRVARQALLERISVRTARSTTPLPGRMPTAAQPGSAGGSQHDCAARRATARHDSALLHVPVALTAAPELNELLARENRTAYREHREVRCRRRARRARRSPSLAVPRCRGHGGPAIHQAEQHHWRCL